MQQQMCLERPIPASSPRCLVEESLCGVRVLSSNSEGLILNSARNRAMMNRISKFYAEGSKTAEVEATPAFGPNLTDHFAIVPLAGGPAGCCPLHQAAYEAARKQVWEAWLQTLHKRMV
jgi:hypothetical protein